MNIALIVIVTALVIIYFFYKKKKSKKFEPITYTADDIKELLQMAKIGDQWAQAELLNHYKDKDFDEFMYWMWVSVYNGYNEEALKSILDLMDFFLPESKNGNLDAKEKLASIYKGELRAYEDRTAVPEQFPLDTDENKELTEQVHLQMIENLNNL